MAILRSGRPQDLDPITLYRVLQLRVDVFVVEQECPYPELDGRDLEPDSIWVWAEQGDKIVATLRILKDPDGRIRIGRVATAKQARADGIASKLMQHALALIGDTEPVLDAQSQLEGWYQRFGFLRSGPEFIEDGISHIPMTRRRAHS